MTALEQLDQRTRPSRRVRTRQQPAPEVPNLDKVVVPAASFAAAAPATSSATSLAQLWRTNKCVGISSREAGAVHRTTHRNAGHGRIGTHGIPKQHPSVSASSGARRSGWGGGRRNLTLSRGCLVHAM